MPNPASSDDPILAIPSAHTRMPFYVRRSHIVDLEEDFDGRCVLQITVRRSNDEARHSSRAETLNLWTELTAKEVLRLAPGLPYSKRRRIGTRRAR